MFSTCAKDDYFAFMLLRYYCFFAFSAEGEAGCYCYEKRI